MEDNNTNIDEQPTINENESAEQKSSVSEVSNKTFCRICYEDHNENLISPCCCKGTMAYVHKTCLEKWLAESNSNLCELCHYVYETHRKVRICASKSLSEWLCLTDLNLGFEIRSVRSDLVIFFMVTPILMVMSYLCVMAVDYYTQDKFYYIPAARWTSVSLLAMTFVMTTGYYSWVYMMFRYHSRVWFYWWQRESIVEIVLPNQCTQCTTNYVQETAV